MKVTSLAPSNIAFIKFFGKENEELRLPSNSSISMCLSEATTITTVEFSEKYKKDEIEMTGDELNPQEKQRVTEHLDRIRKRANVHLFAKVVSKNSFPKSSGIASSASGFAALTQAAAKAMGLNLKEKELTVLARLASGSAARSIPDGFVEWVKGKTHDKSYAYSLYPPDYWLIYDVIVVVEKGMKSVTTTEAHKLAKTSPFFNKRLEKMADKISQLKVALEKKDFTNFSEIVEQEALNMHAVMLTTVPSLLYMTDKTILLIKKIWEWRKKGIEVYFTLDAGPNIHLICEEKTLSKVRDLLVKDFLPTQIIVNKPGLGAKLINQHLF